MTAAVYIVGGRRDHEELRYSLRSLEVNAPDVTQVWVVGHVPGWVQNVRTIELEPLGEKFANQRQSLEAFVNTKGAPVKFYWFNEDHYVIEPVEGPLPTFHLGAAKEWLEKNWRDRNTWFRAVRNTTRWVANRAKQDDVLLYEAHTPLLFDRHKLRELLDGYPKDLSLAVASMYTLAGAGGEGVYVGNSKVKAGDDMAEKLALEMPYTSGNAETFAGKHGEYVRAMFPAPSKWEK